MKQSYPQIAGTLLLLLAGCTATLPPPSEPPKHAVTAAPTQVTESDQAAGRVAKNGAPAQTILTLPAEKATTAPQQPSPSTGASAAQPLSSSSQKQLAVLRVEAGALVTQVNGDPKIRCTHPDCSIPLQPGTHSFTVGYRDTATRAGSKVTYASMYPRVIEVTLEPGHRYTMTASGRYSEKWWIAVEDQTTNKIVYSDREKPE